MLRSSLFLGSRLKDWVWGRESARLVAGLIVVIIFAPCLVVSFLEMSTTARLADEIDRGLLADATLLAYHLECLTTEVLAEERRMPFRFGSKRKEVLSEVLPLAYDRLVIAVKDPDVLGEAKRRAGLARTNTIDPGDFVFEIDTSLGRFRVDVRSVKE